MSVYDKASLVLIPSGTKTSKVYSQKPVSGDGDFTFSRSTAATRVNADGNIEKEIQNNVLQSNTFSSGTWLKQVSGGTTPVVTSGFTDPDGGSNAWRLQCSISGGLYSMISQGLSTTGLNCNSIWIKSNTGSNQDVYFRINNADQSTTRTATTEWQRIEVFTTATGQSFTLGVRSAATGATSSCDVLIYAAQNNQGLVAQDYIETTTAAVEGGITDNVPRLDYTDSSCPTLLLEPQRSNNVVHSEYHQGTIAAVTRTYNTADTLSPEGYYNAVKYEVNANNSDPYLRVFNIPTSGNDATFSLYVKGASGQLFSMILGRDGYDELEYEAFTLDGTWQRLTLSKTFTTTPTTLTIGAEFSHSSNDGVLGQEYYLYGIQCEAASYATSYIPTYGTSVTRNQDASLVTSVSSLIGQPNGSIFLDFVYDNNTSNTRIFSVTGGNWFTNGSIRLEKVSNLFRWNWLKEGVGGASLDSTTTMVKGTRYKMAITYTDSVCSLFINGAKEDTSACDTPTNLSGIYLNELGGGFSDGWEFQRNIFNQVLMFNTTLTDQEAIDLTTI